MNEVDDEGYKYLGVLQDAVLKNREIKEKVGKGWERILKMCATVVKVKALCWKS